MIDPTEHYLNSKEDQLTASKDFHRDSKEHFFGSPIWHEDGPESIGSVITMKRRLYSNTTSYGRGKLILLSLHPQIEEAATDIFSLEIPESFSSDITSILKPKPGVHLEQKDKRTISIKLDSDPFSAKEEDFISLIYTAVQGWLLLNGHTVQELCEKAGLSERSDEVEAFIADPQDRDQWIDFNLGFDLECFLLPD